MSCSCGFPQVYGGPCVHVLCLRAAWLSRPLGSQAPSWVAKDVASLWDERLTTAGIQKVYAAMGNAVSGLEGFVGSEETNDALAAPVWWGVKASAAPSERSVIIKGCGRIRSTGEVGGHRFPTPLPVSAAAPLPDGEDASVAPPLPPTHPRHTPGIRAPAAPARAAPTPGASL